MLPGAAARRIAEVRVAHRVNRPDRKVVAAAVKVRRVHDHYGHPAEGARCPWGAVGWKGEQGSHLPSWPSVCGVLGVVLRFMCKSLSLLPLPFSTIGPGGFLSFD